MPGMLTHYLCGSKLLTSLEHTPLAPVLRQYRQAFNLGTQGPDIFFFYRIWPWTRSRGVNKIGECMHVKNVGAFFSNALQYSKKRSGEERNILTAYICGFACHYALDLTAHPYIFYKSGFPLEGEDLKKKETFFHHRFETAVDYLMLQRETGQSPGDIRYHEWIRVPANQAQWIGQMLSDAISHSHGFILPVNQVCTAMKDMLQVYSFLRDRTGIKKQAFSFLSKFIGTAKLAAYMIYPGEITDGLDYLNLKHTPWSLPWDKSARSSASFPELFDRAVAEAVELLDVIHNYLSGSLDLNSALERISSRSYSTGLDCTLTPAFRYYDCIFTPAHPAAD